MDSQQAEAILDKLAFLMNDKGGLDLIITCECPWVWNLVVEYSTLKD